MRAVILSLLHMARRSKIRTNFIARDLSREEIREIQFRLNRLMTDKNLFLRKRYTLKDLCDDSGYTVHVLSAVINKAENKHFNAYLNHFRIMYCLELFRKEKTKLPRLNELAEICGFNNRNTFSTAFRQITGEKPSAYIKESGLQRQHALPGRMNG
jgi:AraC-like DNA-binding protein